MKTYNKKILETTKNIKDKSYRKAMEHAKNATNPSPKVLRIGAMISGGIGLVFLIAGFIGILLKRELWGWCSLISGIIIVVTNFINIIKYVYKRNN